MRQTIKDGINFRAVKADNRGWDWVNEADNRGWDKVDETDNKGWDKFVKAESEQIRMR